MSLRSAHFRNTVNRRDKICARCASAKDPVAHHIIPLCEEGVDDPSNGIRLCGRCHLEWHACELTGMPFLAFLDTIPAAILQFCLGQQFIAKSPYNDLLAAYHWVLRYRILASMLPTPPLGEEDPSDPSVQMRWLMIGASREPQLEEAA